MRTNVRLNPQESSHVLDDAIRSRCTAVLEFAGAAGRPINGTLISGDPASLLVELSGRPPFDVSKFNAGRCEIRIYHDRRYVAQTVVAALPTWGETQGVTLRRPETIEVIDRRRFLRAKLAPSSKVVLEWKIDGDVRRQSVCLLNVSADGMACRVQDSLTAGLEQRHRLRVRFELPDGDREIELDARVTNFTPASAGSSIMGLQFIASERDADSIRALRHAINRTHNEAEDSAEVHA